MHLKRSLRLPLSSQIELRCKQLQMGKLSIVLSSQVGNLSRNADCQKDEVLFGMRTDGKFAWKTKVWQGAASLLVLGSIDIPKPGFCFDSKFSTVSSAKMSENGSNQIEPKKFIIHPGEVS